MPRCSNCGEMVTPTFARVFGDNDGNVHGCVHCRAATGFAGGDDSDATERADAGVALVWPP